MRNKIIILILSIFILIALAFKSIDFLPKSIQMHYYLTKYSYKYDIPPHIAYNIAYKESRYRGPYHWNYDPSVGSDKGALGPMQIMVRTAKSVNKESVEKSKLRNDIDYNVETSMKLLHLLYDKYHNWDKVCGAYNTGRPIVNKYSKFCVNKNYKKNWINGD